MTARELARKVAQSLALAECGGVLEEDILTSAFLAAEKEATANERERCIAIIDEITQFASCCCGRNSKAAIRELKSE